MRRRGVTLVEIVISLLIGAVFGVSMIKLLASQNRFMAREAMGREARATVSSGLGALGADLRMVQYDPGSSSGLVVSASEPSDSAFTARLPVAFAIACDAATLVVPPYDSTRLTFGGVGATSFDGYAVRTAAGGYSYQTASAGWLTLPSSATACASPSPAISVVAGAGLRVARSSVALVPAPARGGVVMLWVRVRYRIGASTSYTSPPRRALFVTLGTSGVEREMLAPLDTGARFRYFDATGMDSARTSPPADVTTIRGIQVVLPGLSPAVAQARSSPESARLVTAFFFRNAP